MSEATPQLRVVTNTSIRGGPRRSLNVMLMYAGSYIRRHPDVITRKRVAPHESGLTTFGPIRPRGITAATSQAVFLCGTRANRRSDADMVRRSRFAEHETRLADCPPGVGSGDGLHRISGGQRLEVPGRARTRQTVPVPSPRHELVKASWCGSMRMSVSSSPRRTAAGRLSIRTGACVVGFRC